VAIIVCLGDPTVEKGAKSVPALLRGLLRKGTNNSGFFNQDWIAFQGFRDLIFELLGLYCPRLQYAISSSRANSARFGRRVLLPQAKI
jgi:hypothetical protein